MRRLVCWAAFFLCLWPTAAAAEDLVLWHAYRGQEQVALDQLLARFTAETGSTVETLAVPYDAYASKLEAAIPIGEGPDVFIDAHERIGSFVERGLLASPGDAFEEGAFGTMAVAAVRSENAIWAVPLSQKSLALYYRTDLVKEPPTTLEGMASSLEGGVPDGGYLLAYASKGIYTHAAFLHAFGGQLLVHDDAFGFVGPEAEASLRFVKSWLDAGHSPEGADGALVTQLFASGKAPFAISGPWLASDLPAGVPYAVAVLPEVEAAGAPLKPLLTVEALMLSPHGANKEAARALVRHLASKEAAELRMEVARTVSARRDVRAGEGDAFLRVFHAQAEQAIPTPTSVAMRAVWEPADKALRKVLNGTAEVDFALAQAKRRFDDVRRPLPEPASPVPAILILGLLSVAGAFQLVRRAREPRFRERLRASVPAYGYVAHAVVALGILVFAPLLAGAALSLFAGTPGDQFYVGLDNFVQILTARGGPLFASGSFYLVLCVTMLWTVVNVFFHLSIGMALGLLLSQPWLKLRGLYRVLLIIPWAVPSYVTALAWKGMFHRQFGAVTVFTQKVAGLLGMEMEPIAWFARFSTAFTANVATNVWLGFPFMMVVTLAALTSVPKDVLEAAEVDGATRWQRFRLVTFPIIWPSMVPAAVLGAVWTFNMFNVVFLVSGGEPDGTTDILVSEAYRWAFTRQAQYGYAAAYAVLIFLLLFGATKLPGWWKGRKTDGDEGGEPSGDGMLVGREAEA